MKFTNTVDLQQNNIINIVIDPRATQPATGVQGQFYYNTTDNNLYRHDGSNWVPLGIGLIESEDGSIVVDQSGSEVDLGLNVDDTTIEIAPDGQVRIKDGGVSTPKLADGAVTTIKVTDGAITFAKIQDVPTMTVLGRVAAGTGDVSAITIINDNDLTGADGTNLATAGAIKAYVDALVAGMGVLKGSFDAATSTQFPGDSDTGKGDYWYVSVQGTVQGVSLNVGDVLIANTDDPSPTDPNDWIFLETNRDQATTTVLGLVMLATTAEAQGGAVDDKVLTPKTLQDVTATETRAGVSRIATDAEALAGEDDTTTMTPAKVKLILDENVGGYAGLIGNGTNTEYEITHSLGTQSIIAEFFLDSTGEKVMVDYFVISNNAIRAEFSTPPANNSYRVIIKK